MDELNSAVSPRKIVPFFLRMVAILILVTGLVGLLFYLTVIVFELSGRNFLYDFGYKDFSREGMYAVIALYLLLN